MTNKRVIEILNQEKEELLKEENPDWEHITALEVAIAMVEIDDEIYQKHRTLCEQLEKLKALRHKNEIRMTCIDCIHKEVCYKYRLNYVGTRGENNCTDFGRKQNDR